MIMEISFLPKGRTYIECGKLRSLVAFTLGTSFVTFAPKSFSNFYSVCVRDVCDPTHATAIYINYRYYSGAVLTLLHTPH